MPTARDARQPGLPPRRLLPFAILVLFLKVPVWAAPGATSLDFLRIDMAPRPAALGGAFTGLADDANAIAYNPAGLAPLRLSEASLAHNAFINGVQQNYLAFAMPSPRWGSLGLSANVMNVSPFDSFDNNDQPTGSVSAQDTALSAAYAFQWERLALGASGKYIASRLEDVRADATAFDAGGLWTVNENLRLGVSVLNLGSRVRYISDRYPLPLMGRLGASYRTKLPFTILPLTLSADGVFPRARSPYACAGVEFHPLDMAALRVGYEGSGGAGSGVTAGAGLKLFGAPTDEFARSTFGDAIVDSLELDYAFVDMGALGNANRFGLILRFGRDVRTVEEDSKDPGDLW